MLDFAQLPPEVNSVLMYAGPGSSPMLAAAAGWDALAAEMYAAASSYGSLIAGLTDGPWQGPSAASTMAVAAHQVAWLVNTALQVEETAVQAAAAAGAYEAAFGATVPPPEIAANRASLQALSATNLLGQNAAAIAETEVQYAEMWAQDATTMYTYSAASAAASVLAPFNPATTADQALGASLQGLSEVPNALLSLAGLTNNPPWLTNLADWLGLTGHTWNANGNGIIIGGVLGDLVEGLTGSATVDASTGIDTFIRLVSPARLLTAAVKDVQGLTQAVLPVAGKVAGFAASTGDALPQAVSGAVASTAGAVGKAVSVGGLSVPASWAGAAPSATPVSVTLNGLGAAAAAEPAASAFGGLPVVPGTGAGRMAAAHIAAPRYGFKPTVMPHPPAGG